MASVFKSDGSKKYIITWVDEHGRRRKKAGSTDKSVTQRRANEIQRRVDLIRDGVIDPRADAYANHEARPLADHLDAYEAFLRDKGDTAKHVQKTVNRVRRVVEVAGWRCLSDLSPSKATDAMARLRRAEGLSQETLNHYLRAVKAFSCWLWRDSRTRDHALVGLSTTSAEADRRLVRRALTPEESARLVAAAESGPTVKGITGRDRAMCYRVTLLTGFRAGEVATLTPESFRLDGPAPVAVVEAAYCKNRKRATQPIPATLASDLRSYLAGKPPGVPLFPLPADRAAEMLRFDLDRAGIPHKTEDGTLDFHGLRATYITELVASGADAKTFMTLARHSSAALSLAIYAKLKGESKAQTIAALPDPVAVWRATAGATGPFGESA